MKKIIFIIPSLSHGGTNKALENILEFLEKQPYNISIFSIDNNKKNPYYSVFKQYLVPSNNSQLYNLINPIEKSGRKIIQSGILKITRNLYKLTNKDFTLHLCEKVAKNINKNQYDIVIAFQEGIATVLASYIQAPQKIAWIHCDYSVVPQHYKELYYKFNKIVCVSKYTLNSFNKVMPELSNRSIFIYNIVNSQIILNKASNTNNLKFDIDPKIFNIISVGRIDYIKRFKEIPSIADKLVKKNLKFHWYIVGDYNTNEGKELINNIKYFQLQKYITLTGPTNNPYAIMKQCQLYACLSISEACPYVINEAKILHLPIVSTNFPSSYEFINNHENGIICDFNEISDTIIELITETKKYQILKKNINLFSYNNQELETSILALFNYEEKKK